MNYLLRKFIVFILVSGINSCKNLTELDLLSNPNFISPEEAGIDFLYNNVQLNFKNFHNNFHFIDGRLVRYTTIASFTYNNALPPQVGCHCS